MGNYLPFGGNKDIEFSNENETEDATLSSKD
jgi:hypothetical protein